MNHRILALGFALIVLVLAGCGSDTVVDLAGPTTTPPTNSAPSNAPTTTVDPTAGEQRAHLDMAREQWTETRPTSYAMTYELACECDGGPFRVVVTGAETTTVSHLFGGHSDSVHQNVESIFDEIEQALERGEAPVEVTYDATLGYPSTYIFNGPALAYDGGYVLTITDFESDPPEAQAELDEARARWSEAGRVGYDYSFFRGCFCTEKFRGPYDVSVRDGEIVAALFKGTDLFDLDMLDIENYDEIVKTVDDVFDEIERGIGEADLLTVDYDPDTGVPVEVYIDWSSGVADEETSYSIGLVVLG